MCVAPVCHLSITYSPLHHTHTADHSADQRIAAHIDTHNLNWIMSNSSETSSSSLLHLGRPPRLDRAHLPSQMATEDDRGAEDITRSMSCKHSCLKHIVDSPASPTSTGLHPATMFCPPQPEPTMKLDTRCTSLVRLERPYILRRCSSDGQVSTASTLSLSPDKAEGCVDLLRAVQPSGRYAKPRSEWQVSLPLCTMLIYSPMKILPCAAIPSARPCSLRQHYP